MSENLLTRNLAMSREHAAGASYGDLAAKYDLSRSRVQQICDNVKHRTTAAPSYEVRKIRRTISSLQARMNKMAMELSAMTTEVAELERLLDATLCADEGDNRPDDPLWMHS